jgi:LssY C-terminus
MAKITPMTAKKFDRRVAVAAIAAVAAYVVLAYLVAPFAWRHYEHQARLADLDARTITAQGIPGDIINVGLEGTEEDVVCAMAAAGWSPSDPVTLASSLRIAGSVVFRRPYHRAPVSPLYFDGRKQDLAFEKPSGRSASTRHHVRFWKALEAGDDGRPVWLGAAVFDDGVGVSHYTGEITHHTAPDIDAERDFLLANLVEAKRVAATYCVSGVGPSLFGRNGGGDPFFTDGEIAFARLAPGCEAQGGCPGGDRPTGPDRGQERRVFVAGRAAAMVAVRLSRRTPPSCRG